MKIEKHIITAQEQGEHGWVAKYGIPGRGMATIMDDNNRPEYFPSQAEALANAGVCLCAALNGSRRPQAFVTKPLRSGVTLTSAAAHGDKLFVELK